MGEMRRLGLAIVSLAAAAGTAAARPPYDPAVDVQLFELAIGPEPFFTVDGADVVERHELAFDAAYTLETDPFVLPSPHAEVVRDLTTAQLGAAFGLFGGIQVGAALPVILALDGDARNASTGAPAAGGLDVRHRRPPARARGAAVAARRAVARRIAGGGTIATSNGTENAQFTGDNTPSLRGRVAVEWARGRLMLGANVGGIVRTARDVYGVDVGDALTWGVAASMRVADRVAIVGEGFGQIGLTAADMATTPSELVAGIRVSVSPSLAISVGGGAGLGHSLGAPGAQFFLSAAYAKDDRDTDGDGIPDSRDLCPLEPEDKDGFQDADGCPDPDNDHDGIPDAADKCPNEPEDHDGFQDEDGCPDPDNDHDGILDVDDKCPDDPEDGKGPLPHDGCPWTKSDADGDGIVDALDQCPLEEEDFDNFEDGDGCPDLDNDHDGIPDAQDKCPQCPEDKDGFEDADGCPELDNDGDGIPDAEDKCPNDAETINGVQDEDGCPDEGGITVVHLDGDTLIVDKPPSLAGPASTSLSREGALIAGELALVMASHHEVTKWTIAVAQPTAAAAHALATALQPVLARRVTAEVRFLDRQATAKVAGVIDERADPNAPFIMPAGWRCTSGRTGRPQGSGLRPRVPDPEPDHRRDRFDL